jgi:hypothetical protein
MLQDGENDTTKITLTAVDYLCKAHANDLFGVNDVSSENEKICYLGNAKECQ